MNPYDYQNLVAALPTAIGYLFWGSDSWPGHACVTLVESGGQKIIVVVGVVAA
jgi:hypothetical protein